MALQNFGRFAVWTIWYDHDIRCPFNDYRFTISIKIALVSVTMAVVSRSPPNYTAAKMSLGVNSGPVVTESFTSLPLYSKVIFLYGANMNI